MLKKGDKVVVSDRSDWQGWVTCMDETVGETLEVLEENYATGRVKLENQLWYPSNVLRKVA